MVAFAIAGVVWTVIWAIEGAGKKLAHRRYGGHVRTLGREAQRLGLEHRQRRFSGEYRGRRVHAVVAEDPDSGETETRVGVALTSSDAVRLAGELSALSFIGELDARGRVRDGWLECEQPGAVVPLRTLLDDVVDRAEALDELAPTLPQRLAQVAGGPLVPVQHKRAALLVLGDCYPNHVETREACTGAASVQDPELRLLGARALGKAGYRILAELALRESSESGTRAMRRLLSHAPPEVVVKVLSGVLNGANLERIRVAIEELGALRHVASIREILRHARSPAEGVAIAAVEALGVFGIPQIEPVLIDALADPRSGVKRAGIDALSAVGTSRAVEPLLEIVQLVDPGLSPHAQAALWCIQDRHGGVPFGQLQDGGGDGSDDAS